MRRFKHKEYKNVTAHQISGSRYDIHEPGKITFSVPNWVIEESKDWEETDKLIFQSEDGKPVHYNENYWKVDQQFEIRRDTAIGYGHYKSEWPKRFSSREKAEEWVALNKAIFTADEVIKYANMLVQTHSPMVLNDHNFNKGLKEEARRRIFGQVGSC